MFIRKAPLPFGPNLTDVEKDELATTTDDAVAAPPPRPKRKAVMKKAAEIEDDEDDEDIPQVVEGPVVLQISSGSFLTKLMKDEVEKAEARKKLGKPVSYAFRIVFVRLLMFFIVCEAECCSFAVLDDVLRCTGPFRGRKVHRVRQDVKQGVSHMSFRNSSIDS
jgi:hypothetical protein